MKQEFIDILKPAIDKLGYKLLEIGQPNDDGFYRPKVENLDGVITNALGIIYNSKKDCFHIRDFAEQRLESLTVNLKDHTIDTKDRPNSFMDRTEEEKATFLKEKHKQFLNNFKQLEDSGKNNNSLLSSKKLKIFGEAFIAKTYSFSKNSPIKEPLVVPFRNEKGELVGAQLCFRDKSNKSQKFAVPGSIFKNTVCVLQEGKQIEAVNMTPVLICESYTTACEVAEAQPNSTVICSAGISGVMAAFSAYSPCAEGHYAIYVCDKTAHNLPNKAVDKLIETLTNEKIPFIQLDKTNNRLLSMTDFNDYALEYGKTAVKKEIDLQTKRWLPLSPEVLTGDEKFYKIVSSVNNKVVSISRNTVLKSRLEFANQSFWNIFDRMYHITDDNKKPFRDWLALNESRNAQTVSLGVGIHKDLGGFVANTYRGKFIKNKSIIDSSFDLKPFGKNLYIDCADDDEELLLDKKFTTDDLNFMIDLWKKTYDTDVSHFLGLLGYCIQATYASFSPRRAHIWVTGVSGSGKSDIILKNFIYRLMKGLVLPVESATEAGIRQQLTPPNGMQNSPLITIDEAASDSQNKTMRMDEIIKLARETATNDGTKRGLRGTKEQDGRVYRQTCSLALASTVATFKDIQELSRFILFEVSSRAFKYKKSSDFDYLEQQMKRLNPAFIRACLEAAPHFVELVGAVNDRLRAQIPDVTRYAQKVFSLTACVAGLAALIKVIKNCTTDEAADTAVKRCDTFIQTQLELQENQDGETGSVVEDILNTEILESGDKFDLTSTLLGDQSQLSYYKKYGIFIRDDKLIIRLSKFKAHVLLTNSRLVLVPIHNIKGRMLDEAERGPGIEKSNRVRCPLNKENRITVFIIDTKGRV